MHRKKKNRMIDVSCTILFSLIHTTKSVFFFLQNDLDQPVHTGMLKSAGWDGLEGRESLRAGSLQRGTPFLGRKNPSSWEILTAFSKTAVDLIRREVQWARTPKLFPLSAQNKNQSFLSKEIDKHFPSSTIQEVVGPSVEF